MKSMFATRRFSCLVQQVLHLRPLTIVTAVVAITLSQLSEAKVVYTPVNVSINNSTYNLARVRESLDQAGTLQSGFAVRTRRLIPLRGLPPFGLGHFSTCI
jgi:hypothetical protein